MVVVEKIRNKLELIAFQKSSINWSSQLPLLKNVRQLTKRIAAQKGQRESDLFVFVSANSIALNIGNLAIDQPYSKEWYAALDSLSLELDQLQMRIRSHLPAKLTEKILSPQGQKKGAR